MYFIFILYQPISSKLLNYYIDISGFFYLVGQQGGEETEGENISTTMMTGIVRNIRTVGGLAHRSRGAGQKGQQKPQVI